MYHYLLKLQSFRASFSLRKIVLVFPAGSPAPRLRIWPKIPVESTPLRNTSNQSYDDIFTSTSDLSDFDSDCSNSLSDPQPSGPVRPLFSTTNSARDPFLPENTNSGIHSSSQRMDIHESFYSMKPYISYDSSSCRVHYVRNGKKCSRETDSGIVLCDYHCTCRSRRVTPLPDKLQQPRGRSSDWDECERGLRQPRTRTALRSAAANRRITQLEFELSRLRSQLAELIIRQEGKAIPYGSSDEVAMRADADGQSDGCDFQSVTSCTVESRKPLLCLSKQSVVIQPAVSISIPPPPPLPSNFPCPSSIKKASNDDWRARLIEKRKGSSVSSQSNIPKTPSSDMSQVLRELQTGTIKLRSVPRSPGGTPIRAQRSSPLNLALDPSSIISHALRNKLSRMRAALNVSHSDDGDSREDSFLENVQPVVHIEACVTSVSNSLIAFPSIPLAKVTFSTTSTSPNSVSAVQITSTEFEDYPLLILNIRRTVIEMCNIYFQYIHILPSSFFSQQSP
ncbi:hypothetical protein FGIG_10531 [Fasciola gigantica]|uniref:Mitochondrial fission regulator 2 n=1 Tax=Fasciola gigantica TaxID=46835 RepID=A0A504YXM5_FASGI|nr:hypothetical protein FGIG_10531 [Fasciola gigantica]